MKDLKEEVADLKGLEEKGLKEKPIQANGLAELDHSEKK